MIEALTSQFGQFFYGTRYKKMTDTQGDHFQYEMLVAPRKSYGQIINNLIAEQGALTIKTNWDLDFKVREFVVDNGGKKWQISEIQYMPQEINPQVMAISLTNPDTDIVLSLIEVENVEELK